MHLVSKFSKYLFPINYMVLIISLLILVVTCAGVVVRQATLSSASCWSLAAPVSKLDHSGRLALPSRTTVRSGRTVLIWRRRGGWGHGEVQGNIQPTPVCVHLRFKQAQPKMCHSPKFEDWIEKLFFTFGRIFLAASSSTRRLVVCRSDGLSVGRL